MTARQVLWFGAAYLVVVALAVWFNLAIIIAFFVRMRTARHAAARLPGST